MEDKIKIKKILSIVVNNSDEKPIEFYSIFLPSSIKSISFLSEEVVNRLKTENISGLDIISNLDYVYLKSINKVCNQKSNDFEILIRLINPFFKMIDMGVFKMDVSECKYIDLTDTYNTPYSTGIRKKLNDDLLLVLFNTTLDNPLRKIREKLHQENINKSGMMEAFIIDKQNTLIDISNNITYYPDINISSNELQDAINIIKEESSSWYMYIEFVSKLYSLIDGCEGDNFKLDDDIIFFGDEKREQFSLEGYFHESEYNDLYVSSGDQPIDLLI